MGQALGCCKEEEEAKESFNGATAAGNTYNEVWN
jgi:hypothetical protein